MTEPGRTPGDGVTAEQPTAPPSVRTAPAGSGPFSRIPSHLGRARTSTVVLALLFVGIFALYLTIRPPQPGVAPATTSDTGTVQPAPAPVPAPSPTTTAPPTSSAPPTSAEPTTTDPETTSAPASETEPEPTADEEPSDTTVPEETTAPTRPSVPSPTSRAGTPTAGSPSG